MTRVRRIVVAVVAVVLLASCVPPAPAVQRHRVEWLAFETLNRFDRVEAKHGWNYEGEYWWMDWSTDGCSGGLTPDRMWYYDFRRACRRHDFSYRNFKKVERDTGQDLWNAYNRQQIDDQFYIDMEDNCSYRGWVERGWCLLVAKSWYDLVRQYGGPLA